MAEHPVLGGPINDVCDVTSLPLPEEAAEARQLSVEELLVLHLAQKRILFALTIGAVEPDPRTELSLFLV